MTTRNVLISSLFALLVSAPAAHSAQNAQNLDGPVTEIPSGAGGLDAWTFEVELVNGCYALVTGTVTASGGGSEQAALTTYDNGVLIDSYDFSFPANGSAHPYCWVYRQIGDPDNGDVAIALRDDPLSLDAYDFLPLSISGTCTGAAPSCGGPVAIPTIAPAGLGALALALLGAAILVLRRHRRA